MAEKTNGKPRSKLYVRTLFLLKNRPRTLTLQMIAEGANVPHDWIASVIRNTHMSPGIDRMERLYEFLAKHPLNVP